MLVHRVSFLIGSTYPIKKVYSLSSLGLYILRFISLVSEIFNFILDVSSMCTYKSVPDDNVNIRVYVSNVNGS